MPSPIESTYGTSVRSRMFRAHWRAAIRTEFQIEYLVQFVGGQIQYISRAVNGPLILIIM